MRWFKLRLLRPDQRRSQEVHAMQHLDHRTIVGTSDCGTAPAAAERSTSGSPRVLRADERDRHVVSSSVVLVEALDLTDGDFQAVTGLSLRAAPPASSAWRPPPNEPTAPAAVTTTPGRAMTSKGAT